MKQTQNNSFDSQQVLSVIEQYSTALDLLDAYDHQTMERPKGNEAAYVLTYEECMHVIACMRFGKESDLFGKEKDDSFKGKYRKHLSVFCRHGSLSDVGRESGAFAVFCDKES